MATIIDPPNSVWPNGLKVDSEGFVTFYPLGTNKVDISAVTWPDGNELVSPFVYKDDKLVGFVDTKALTTDSQTLIYLPYKHIEADFSSIEKGKLSIHAPKATTKKASWKDSEKEDLPEAQFKYKGYTTINQIKNDFSYDYLADIANGTWSEPLWDLEKGGDEYYEDGMFYQCSALTTFTSDLPNLTNGKSMFQNCENLNSFSSDLPSLTNGAQMFHYCENLSEFDTDLPKLTDADSMFAGCSNLGSFTSDLPSLTNGKSMFHGCSNLESFSSDISTLTNGILMFNGCTGLESFSSDLPRLTNAEYMFESCIILTSFSSDLSSLMQGDYMFHYCPNLRSFSSDLPSLTDGTGMFQNCINLTSFSADLGSLIDGGSMFTDCKLDASSVKNIIDTINTVSNSGLSLGMGCYNTTEDANLFAQEVGYADMTSLLAALHAKGWTVKAQYKGRPDTTYSLRRPSEDTLPVFVKVEEVDGEVITINQATHTNEDGSMSYRLTWFHETTGSTEGYTQFASLEEAIETLNIKSIEN